MKISKGGPDVAGLIERMQQQLSNLEKKIDILIEKNQNNKPFQQQTRPQVNVPRPQNNNFNQRMLHKATCADCRKECEVPFRPTGDRPVYCKECFAKRKNGNPFKQQSVIPPGPVARAQAAVISNEPQPMKKKAVRASKVSKKKAKTRSAR